MRTAVLPLCFLMLAVPVAPVAQVIPIDDVQVYDPATGTPLSPYYDQSVTVEGVVYVTAGTFSDGGRYILGATGGINVYEPGPPYFSVGDSIRVAGMVWEDYNQELYIDDPVFELLGSGPPPEPRRAPIMDVVDEYEGVGDFFSVVGIVTGRDADGFELVQAADTLRVFIDPDTTIDLGDVEDGDRYLVAGPCIKHGAEVRLTPRSQADLVEDPPGINIIVRPDSTGDYPTIQDAVHAAAPGDSIILDGLVFTGPGNTEVKVPDKDLVIRSLADDPASCTIDCDDGGPGDRFAFTFDKHVDKGTVLSGVTITGGFAETDTMGAGVNLEGDFPQIGVQGARPYITNIYFIDNMGTGVLIKGSSSAFQIEYCRFEGNTGNGIGTHEWSSYWSAGPFVIRSCTFSDSGKNGLYAWLCTTGVVVDSCTFTSNSLSGIHLVGDPMNVYITDSILQGNGNYGAYLNNGPGLSTDHQTSRERLQYAMNCVNTIVRSNASGGLVGWEYATISVDSCQIIANDGDGIVASNPWFGAEVYRSIIADNQGDAVSVFANPDVPVKVESATIIDNRGSALTTGWSHFLVDNSIIAHNDGLAIDQPDYAQLQISNTDLYGNAGGDWIPEIQHLQDQAGNLSADPHICSLVNGEYTVASDSPCLPENHPDGNGEIIGALDEGCNGEQPLITAVTDVPGDQGRQVRVRWLRSYHDEVSSGTPVTGYSLWRRIAPVATAGPAVDRFPDGDWDYVASVPARLEDAYHTVVPTLCDAVGDSICWSAFFVSAETAVPSVFFDSPPDSGYSVDNLEPAAPSDLQYLDVTLLGWSEAEEPDFAYYTVYGSFGDTFPSVTDTALATTVSPAWDTAGHDFAYYHVTARDFAGNESSAATVVNPMSAIPEAAAALALHQNRPNPFNPSTEIRFDLPHAAVATVTVYDLAGRRVRYLAEREFLAAGTHVRRWDGRDRYARPAPTGAYVVRLECGANTLTRRIMLLR